MTPGSRKRPSWRPERCIHAVYDWSRPLTAIVGLVLMEFGDFAMMRRMLRGIKVRAESVDDTDSFQLHGFG